MAVQNPPGWIQALSTHTAAQLRMYTAATLAGTSTSATVLKARGGVHPGFGAEFNVTQAGSPNMTVLVEAGACSIPGTESSTQGNYFVVNDAQVTLSVTAAHATLARIDIVVVNVRDAQYSGANNDCQLQVIAGTPGSPSAPSAPNNSITIAQIAVGAAVTSIVNANITDTRDYLAGVGGVINTRNIAAAPASTQVTEGQLIWSNAADSLHVWDGSAYNQIFPGYNKISESILGGTTASVTFSSLTTRYRGLYLFVQARSDTAALTTNLLMRFNADSGANYDTQSLFGQTTTAGAVETVAGTSMSFPDIAAASAGASHAGVLQFFIPTYTGTTFIKTVEGSSTSSFNTGAGTLITRRLSGRWRSTSAITSITLLPAAGSFVTGSNFSIYGIP